MVLYYLLLAHCLSLWYSTTSTGSLPIPMAFYYLLLAPCLSLWHYTNVLLAHCLSLWYSPTYFWPTAYSTIHYWLQPILMILFYLLLIPARTFGSPLPSTAFLPIIIVLSYLLPAHCLLYYPLLDTAYTYDTHLSTSFPCQYLWYSSTFYCLPAYTYDILLSFTGYMPIPMVLYHLLPDPCLYLWYSTIFYCLNAYPFCTLLSSTGSLPIPMVFTTFYWPTAYTYGILLPST